MNISHKTYRIATVTKVKGNHAWFDRMEKGVMKFGRDTGHNTFVAGPPKADGNLQKQVIDDVVAHGVDALCVVPFYPQALEMSLRMAQKKGIVIISHEAENLRNTDYDIEAFENPGYGVHLMDHFARYMGKEGRYAILLASITTPSHNEWTNAAINRQHTAYPKMRLAAKRIQDHDNADIAYQKTKELLTAASNLRGLLGIAMSSCLGAGRAIEELGLQQQIVLVGSGLVSTCKSHLTSGATKLISFWDPADAGYVMNKLAVMALEGRPITDGIDLGISGYRKVNVNRKTLYGSAWIDVTKETMHQYRF